MKSHLDDESLIIMIEISSRRCKFCHTRIIVSQYELIIKTAMKFSHDKNGQKEET